MERRAETRAAEAAALRDAYERHATALLALCVLLVGQRTLAEDLVHEAFLRAAPKLADLEPHGVRPYLRATASISGATSSGGDPWNIASDSE